MGTHRNSHSAKLNRTLAFGAVTGATAIGVAVAAMTAPAAQADWFGGASGLGSGNASGNDLLEGNGNGNGNNNYNQNNQYLGGVHGNGNTNQTTWGSGNTINNQLSLGFLNPVVGGIAINASVTASIGGFSTAIAAPVTAPQRHQHRCDTGAQRGNLGVRQPRRGGGSWSGRLECRRPNTGGNPHQCAGPHSGQRSGPGPVRRGHRCLHQLRWNCDSQRGSADQHRPAERGEPDPEPGDRYLDRNEHTGVELNGELQQQPHADQPDRRHHHRHRRRRERHCGSANSRINTTAAAGGNVAQSPSETNTQSGSGKNSANTTGNGSNTNNTNGGGNTTNRNNGD